MSDTFPEINVRVFRSVQGNLNAFLDSWKDYAFAHPNADGSSSVSATIVLAFMAGTKENMRLLGE